VIKKINHIAIAVWDIDKAIAFHRDILKLDFHGYEELPEIGCAVAFFSCGEVEVELVSPIGERAFVKKHLETVGEGLYHIAYEVDSIQAALDYFAKENIPLRSPAPKPGSRNTRVGYLEAEGACGVITELVELAGKN
jgi:methylmalonyl-CoA epimerase